MEKRIHHPFIFSICLAIALSVSLICLGREVTDQLGRTISLASPPTRIVSLAPNITELVYALGQQHRLVGATRFSDYPPEADSLPKVGSYVYLDLEKIVGLKPDLCIATKDGNPKAVVDRLEVLGIPVYAVDPRNLESVIDTVVEMGDLLGAVGVAQTLQSGLLTRIQRVDKAVAEAGYRPRVFFQIGMSPIVSVGTDTFIHGLIEKAGGRNVAGGSTPYPRLSREQVIAFAPDILVISSMYSVDAVKQVKAEWGRWQEIPAVRNNRIHLVDSGRFDRATPRLVDALEALARLIHPDLFGESR